MKKFWVGKVVGALIIVPIVFALVTLVVMSLWNNVLVAVLHVGLVSFWQAAGILLLSKILFGFGGGRWKNRGQHGFGGRREMMEKWSTMTPEEKVKFKQEFRNRCGGRSAWGPGYDRGGPFEGRKSEETPNA
jgi:hypothetical protein